MNHEMTVEDYDDQQEEDEDSPGINLRPVRRKTTLFDFANVDMIKMRVREKRSKVKTEYNVHNLYHEEGFFSWLAKHPLFENITLGVIVANAMWISIDTDGNNVPSILVSKPIFIVMDTLFFAYFSLELFTRFMAFETKRNCCQDGWFMFDTALVALYAFDPFGIGLMHAMSGQVVDLPTAMLRLCRLARLSRLVKMLRSLPELMIMIKGISKAAKTVCYSLGFLLMVTYVFAILFVNISSDKPCNENNICVEGKKKPPTDFKAQYFPDVHNAMLSLIVFGTFMDALSDFFNDMVSNGEYACYCFAWIYVCIAALSVMNMLVGILCGVIAAVALEENEISVTDKVYDKFHKIATQLDKDGNGVLSWSEFQELVQYPEALNALEEVNVDAESFIDIAEDIFHDEEGQKVDVTFDEFMGIVLDLRGGQTATIKDMMRQTKQMNRKFISCKDRVGRMERTLKNITGQLDALLNIDKHINANTNDSEDNPILETRA